MKCSWIVLIHKDGLIDRMTLKNPPTIGTTAEKYYDYKDGTTGKKVFDLTYGSTAARVYIYKEMK